MRRVVLLATDGDSTRICYQALRTRFADVAVVLEQPISRWQLLRGRLRSAGIVSVAGQLLFMTLALPLLRHAGRARSAAICDAAGLNAGELPPAAHRIGSVNTPAARDLLRALDPAVVVVNGTRIIGRQTLAAVQAPFINMHAGITPLYRGVHGGYWAMAEGRPELAGTTVHTVDVGIDTGAIIDQSRIEITPADNFATYPYLHIAAGVPMLLAAVDRALAGNLQTKAPPPLPSRLRYHPTLWGYLSGRVTKGAR
jgi:methionyl-tRNA formyltransferase